MHPKLAALLILCDRLDHRAEDIRIDLRPVEIANVEEIGTCDLAEAGYIHVRGKEAAVNVRKRIGPSRYSGVCPVLDLRVNGAEQSSDDFVRVGGVLRAHMRDGIDEQTL